LGLKVDVSQYLVPAKVSKGDVRKADVAADLAQGHGVWVILDLGLCVEDLEHALARGRRLRDGSDHPAQAAHGARQLAHIGGEGDERADGQRAEDHEAPTVEQDKNQARAGDQLEQGLAERVHARGADVEPKQVPDLVFEAADLVVLLGKGLDDARTAQVLLEAGGHVGHLLLDHPRERPVAHTEPQPARGQKGNDDQGKQR
jgi:hypothetical protein